MTFCEELVEICNCVVKSLGKGYTEGIYQEAICTELRGRNIKYSKENVIPVIYKDVTVGYVRADIVLPILSVVIECKSIENELREVHLPQILTYMKNMDLKTGYFVNFIQSPGKGDVEIYEVSSKESKYIFEEVVRGKMVQLDTLGRRSDETEDIVKWMTDNIIQEDTEVLMKKELLETYKQNELKKIFKSSGQFIAEIEQYCGSSFDKGTIRGWLRKN